MIWAAVLVAFSPLAGAGAHAPGADLPLRAVTAPPAEHRADPSLKTHVVRVGPFDISGYQTFRHNDHVPPPPVKGSIVGMDVRVVDRRGREIPQHVLMLHHNVFTNGGPDGQRKDGACPHRSVWERFYGTSEELRPLTLPRGYGYPTSPEDRWKMIWMVMNHRHERRTAYVEYRMTVDPSPDVTPVKPYWVSVVPCVSDPQYTVPGGGEAGSTHTRSRGFTVPETGRIVAVGGHLHGGSHELRLTQPGCDRRTIALNDPVYAPAGDPLYAVRPLLHEPDPKNITWTQWSDGWGVTAGQRLRLSAVYDNERPHMRVMGIAHVYLAPDESVPPGCSEPPTGGETLGPAFEGRREPPASKLTLASWDGNGRARAITRPPGAIRRVSSSSAAVRVENFAFNPAVLSVPRDATVRWSFRDRTVHDATLVVGPRGFATATTRGRTARHRFRVPGEYRLNCSIHPVLMQQVIRVRPGR